MWDIFQISHNFKVWDIFSNISQFQTVRYIVQIAQVSKQAQVSTSMASASMVQFWSFLDEEKIQVSESVIAVHLTMFVVWTLYICDFLLML